MEPQLEFIEQGFNSARIMCCRVLSEEAEQAILGLETRECDSETVGVINVKMLKRSKSLQVEQIL